MDYRKPHQKSADSTNHPKYLRAQNISRTQPGAPKELDLDPKSRLRKKSPKSPPRNITPTPSMSRVKNPEDDQGYKNSKVTFPLKTKTLVDDALKKKLNKCISAPPRRTAAFFALEFETPANGGLPPPKLA
jgi:hypothetical protein